MRQTLPIGRYLCQSVWLSLELEYIEDDIQTITYVLYDILQYNRGRARFPIKPSR